MGYFDDIVPPDTASSYVATPPGVPRITVRPSSDQLDDMPGEVGLAPNQFEPWGTGEGPSGKVARSPRTAGLFDDIVAPAAQHKAAIERALSTTVPLRLQHPQAVEIAAGLMANHGMPLDEALDRATMRVHAEEGTAEVGKISDIIGKDAFDEAQRAPASPDLVQPATGLGQGRASTEEQARPNGEHASGDGAPQGGDAAGEKTIGSEGAGPTDNRAQSRDELVSAAAKGEGGDQGPAVARHDVIVARTSGEQRVLPTIERIGGEAYTQRAARGEFDPKLEEEPPDKGPPSDEIKQTNLLAAPRPQGGVSDSAADATATDFFNQLAAPELAQSQALTDYVQQHPKAAAAEGALGLGVVLSIPVAGAAGLLGAGAAAATRAAAGGRRPFGIGPYAGESIPARSAARNFTAAERAEINRIGAKTGCHTCGTKNPGTMYGNFVLDHQTPSALNWEGAPQRLYPQCKACSDAQGLGIIRLLSRLRGPR